MNLKTLFTVAAGVGTALVNSVSGEPIEVGVAAPTVTVPDQDGNSVDLGKAYESGLVLIYFYPKADTPGCTAQACSLRDSYEELQDRGVLIYGVSMDTPAEQKEFKEKYHLPFTLLADSDGKLVEAFGVPRRGRFASRQAFLIEDGKVIWRDTSASTAKQAADVLTVLDERKTD